MTNVLVRLDDILRSDLEPDGFQLVRRCHWVAETSRAIRKIFQVRPLKGATYSARWGFSIDFVPVWRGPMRRGRLQPKRTSRTADFDLAIAPLDELGSAPSWCSFQFIEGYREPLDGDLRRIARDACKEARRAFARVASISDLVGLFQEREGMTFRGLGLYNYVQTNLAWGLALLATGQMAEGERRLAAFCEMFGVDRADPVLHQSEQAAIQYASKQTPERGTA